MLGCTGWLETMQNPHIRLEKSGGRSNASVLTSFAFFSMGVPSSYVDIFWTPIFWKVLNANGFFFLLSLCYHQSLFFFYPRFVIEMVGNWTFKYGARHGRLDTGAMPFLRSEMWNRIIFFKNLLSWKGRDDQTGIAGLQFVLQFG